MSISKILEDMTKYLTEAFAKIFGPREDDVPEIGVQPFECEPYVENSSAKA